jgi:hypothetical protein
MLLIEIINEANSSCSLIQSALIQLKKTIDRYWEAKKFEIKAAEKYKIRLIVINMIINFQKMIY